jgi:hypothetical protein
MVMGRAFYMPFLPGPAAGFSAQPSNEILIGAVVQNRSVTVWRRLVHMQIMTGSSPFNGTAEHHGLRRQRAFVLGRPACPVDLRGPTWGRNHGGGHGEQGSRA